MGLPVAATLAEAARQLESEGFAYLPLEGMSPRLYEIIQLRLVLGLRSPVHTMARMLNPFAAPYLLVRNDVEAACFELPLAE